MNSSLPEPPCATSGACVPGLSQPRVVAIKGREEPRLGCREAAVGHVALGAEDLPDLEAVVVGAAVEGDDRRRVVGEERVVAAAGRRRSGGR